MAQPLPILYRDLHLLVADKPAGLLSVGDAARGARGVAEALAGQGLAARPVHRLDREVSGAILCACSAAARGPLEDLFREQRIHKTYWALVRGRPPADAGELSFPILEEGDRARVSARGKPARTRYRTLRRLPEATELEIELLTGRKNQIRVHLAHAGAALVGETKYAKRRDDPLGAGRLALHSWRLAFEHPWTRAPLALEAPLPSQLLELLSG